MNGIAHTDWRHRFRAPRIWSAELAARRPERGLVVATQDGDSVQLFAWEVPAGRLTALTREPYGVVEGWLDPLGAYVYYLRDGDGTELGHIVRVPFTGGEVRDVTPGMAPYTLRAVGFSGDGGLLAFNSINVDGYALYTVDIRTGVGPPQLLYRDHWPTYGALLSARGDLAACWSAARARGLRRYTLLAFDTATGALVGELDDGDDAAITGVCFSPIGGDNRVLADTTRGGFTRPVVWDPRTGRRRDLTLPGLPGDVRPTSWSTDGGRLLLCHFDDEQALYVHDLHSGQTKPLAHPVGAYAGAVDGGPAFGPDGSIVGLQDVAVAPPRVVELDDRTGEQRRVLLDSAPVPDGRPWRSIRFLSSDGTPVQGWLSVPEGPGPYPTILEVHGGPHYAVHGEYDPGAQCWVEHGYAWLTVNYRGSTGFGRRFAEQIWGDLGHWELDDMVAARDWLVAQGIAEPTEVFVHGESYGGYLTLLALGRRPDLWLGGLAVVANADLRVCYEHSSEALRGAIASWMTGTPEELPEDYVRCSPITYAADVSAPVLVIQARNDTRVPRQQMEGYERRMRELGKDIEVVWLDGGHRSAGPAVRVRWYELMLAFTQKILATKRA